MKLSAPSTKESFEQGQPVNLPRQVTERPRSELFGSLVGKVKMSPDWNSDATNTEIEGQFEGIDAFQDELPG